LDMPIDSDGGRGAASAAQFIVLIDNIVVELEVGRSVPGAAIVVLGAKAGAGKNDPHGREPGKKQLDQLKALEKKYEEATGADKTKIGNKIKNIKTSIAAGRTGETHGRRGQGRR